MSFAICPAALFADTRLNRTDLRVYGALATFADAETRTCWPYRKTIGEVCGIKSVSLISEALNRLQGHGWVEITHRLGSSLYRLLEPSAPVVHPVVDTAIHPVVDDMEQTNLTDHLPPAPAPASPQPPETTVASLEREDQDQVAPTPEDSSDPDSDALQVVLALIAASGAQYPTKPRSGPLRAAEKALAAGYTVEQLKMVVTFCATTWSNPRFLTPSAVLKLSRLDERLAAAQAQAPAGTRAQCHKPFEREPEPERADPRAVRGHLSRLKKALAGS